MLWKLKSCSTDLGLDFTQIEAVKDTSELQLTEQRRKAANWGQARSAELASLFEVLDNENTSSDKVAAQFVPPMSIFAPGFNPNLMMSQLQHSQLEKAVTCIEQASKGFTREILESFQTDIDF